MAKRVKSFSEKEKDLIARIDHAKKALLQLHERRQRDIGALAIKHGLDLIDNATLEHLFQTITHQAE